MNNDREDIILMPRTDSSGIVWWPLRYDTLERFAALVAAEEREECARVCDKQGKGRYAMEHYAALTYSGATHDCAAAIRARGKR